MQNWNVGGKNVKGGRTLTRDLLKRRRTSGEEDYQRHTCMTFRSDISGDTPFFPSPPSLRGTWLMLRQPWITLKTIIKLISSVITTCCRRISPHPSTILINCTTNISKSAAIFFPVSLSYPVRCHATYTGRRRR